MKGYSGNIIDTHTHIYPEKIVVKATEAIGRFYDAPMQSMGTVEILKNIMKNAGVSRAFILSTATVPQQVRGINDYLLSVMADAENKKLFVPFGTVHPDMENTEEELDYIRANGIVGLKFHPDFQKFAVDDRRMDIVYDYARQYRMPVIFHAGDKRYHYSNPVQYKNIIERFPDLIGVAAHFGGYSEWDSAYELLAGTNYYFDTSSTLSMPGGFEWAEKILKKHDISRILFGSDFPMWDASDEKLNIERLNLTPAETEKVMYYNAVELLMRIS